MHISRSQPVTISRLAAFVVLMLLLPASPLGAQIESTAESATAPRLAAANTTPQGDASNSDATGGRNLLQVVLDGGLIGLFIILLSLASVGLIIEHCISIRKGKLAPDFVVYELEELLQKKDIGKAVECCEASGSDCLVAAVVHAALLRYQRAQFGFAEYNAAAEEAGQLFTSRLYRKTTPLALIAAIAPMLGLSGTVLGMIEAFNTIASTGGMASPDQLASGIGKALITTLLGLFVAMPSMVAVTYFRNRIDAIVGETGSRLEQILLPLSQKS